MTFDHKSFLSTLTNRPGVYRMLGAEGRVLYVGKARQLKKRVSSYFRANLLDPKTVALMQQVCNIEVTITRSETEALLLESNLIKELHPPYNILLRDDKSYLYLFLSAHEKFPRLVTYRGARHEKGEYFGPYTSVAAVHETLELLQKLFKIRQCSDPFFASRTRPCLQYQIKRCSAPCVDYIDSASYQEDVQHARLFLIGKNEAVIQALITKMERASGELQFEDAARIRDQIVNLRKIHTQQSAEAGYGHVDVIAAIGHDQVVCVGVITIRNGRWIGSRCYFPKVPHNTPLPEVLAEFLPQYYLSANRGTSLPQRIYINHALAEKNWLEQALSEQWGYKVAIVRALRGQGKVWLQTALENAQHALDGRLSSQSLYSHYLSSFQKEFHLTELPQRFECFDISHTLGEATVASCVVFGGEGAIKDDYRRFNIKNVVAGDDYGAMQQALTRHFTALKAATKSLPDVLIIDGGKGQLSRAIQVLEELQVVDVLTIAIAKGPTRKAGLETLWIAGQAHPLSLPADSLALHLLQRIRDEAHRFAITGHRQQRAKARVTSRLEEIPGIGASRRRELLRHFGGLQGVMNASLTELAKVPGVNIDLAKRLYDNLHGR